MPKSTMHVILLSFVISLPCISVVKAQKAKCLDAQTTGAQEECANTQLKAAEAEMHEALKTALKSFTSGKEDSTALQQFDKNQQFQWKKRMQKDLVMSQEAWLIYRRASSGAVNDSYENGSSTGVAVTACMTELTSAREKFLKDNFLQGQ